MQPLRNRFSSSVVSAQGELSISGSLIVKASTINKLIAFGHSFIATLLFNYTNSLSDETTKNEFLPSVKDCIGTVYPIEDIYQMLIAIQSFLQLMHYFIWILAILSTKTYKTNSTSKTIGIFALIGSIKLFSLICFSLITFRDDADTFNNFFVLYLLSCGAWIHFIRKRISSKVLNLNKTRKKLEITYGIGVILGMIFFYKHQVQRVQVAYSISALFQWMLIFIEIYFDWLSKDELKDLVLRFQLGDNWLHRKSEHV